MLENKKLCRVHLLSARHCTRSFQQASNPKALSLSQRAHTRENHKEEELSILMQMRYILGSFEEGEGRLGWLSRAGATGGHQCTVYKGAKVEKDEMTSTRRMLKPELELSSLEPGFPVCPSPLTSNFARMSCLTLSKTTQMGTDLKNDFQSLGSRPDFATFQSFNPQTIILLEPGFLFLQKGCKNQRIPEL